MYQKLSLLICLSLCACSGLKEFTLKRQYSKIDPIIYKGEQYLLPIPSNYCKYDAKDVKDKALLDMYEDAANFEEEMIKQIGIYVDCDLKDKLYLGDIRYAPRVISVAAFPKLNVKYIPKNKVVKVMNKANDSVDESRHVKYLKSYSHFILDKKNLAKYNFSSKRDEITKEDANYIIDHDIDFKRINSSLDKNGAYVQSHFANDYSNFYQTSIFTKIKDNVLMIAFEDNIKEAYDDGDLLKLRKEIESYAKLAISKNDAAIRQYKIGDKKINLKTPKGFEYISHDNLNKVLLAGYLQKGLILAEASFKIDDLNNFFRFSLNFADSEIANKKLLETRKSFLDIMQKPIKDSADLNGYKFSRQENGIMVVASPNKNVSTLSYMTLVNNYPLEISVEIYNKDRAIADDLVEELRRNLVDYVGALDVIN